jgi:biotin transport system substrate-specific component
MSGSQLVLADRIGPSESLLRNAALPVLGSLLIVLCARIEIPLTPVPITAQTFGVLLVGALLGSRRGVISILLYLGFGAIGLPVFAGGASGLARFAGPTAGYLLGFVAAAAIVGWLSERGWDRRAGTTALAMVFGMAVIYSFGTVWLSRFVGWERVLTIGVLPFIPGDVLKLTLATVALPSGWLLIDGPSGRCIRRS